jgi:3-oxoacyl-[acyl-carrier protein] reductase
MELKGKTAVVTGSTKGIGKAIATALVRGDVNVVVSSRKSAEIELTVAELNKIGLGRVCRLSL